MEQLTSVKSLTMLSLLHNPVVTRRNYREYVIHKFPNLRVLDFKKVKDKESKLAYLNKIMSVVELTLGITLEMRPAKVVAGMDVVSAIEGVKTGPGDRPVEPVTVETVVISE